MKSLSQREKRLIRYASIGIGIYLALFFIGKPLAKNRTEYQRLVAEARTLQDRIEPYSARVERVQKLMDAFRLDPVRLTNSTVIGDASAAIQKAAMGNGVQLAAVRETVNRSSAGKELASMQVEGMGQVQGVCGFLKSLETLGFPVIVESVQITAEKAGPGMLKLNLTLVILDFEHWNGREKPNA